jgi:hypothetical protein
MHFYYRLGAFGETTVNDYPSVPMRIALSRVIESDRDPLGIPDAERLRIVRSEPSPSLSD